MAFHFLNLNSDNHGQKSWDKFTFVALFQTRQTNSHARIHLHLVSPSPTAPRIQCWTRVHVISPEFQHFMGGGGAGGGVLKQRNLKRITVLF